MPVYRPGRASPGPQAGKLSSNEAPLGPSPDIQAAIAASLGRVNRYPEPAQAVEALASYAGTTPDRIVLTNGSDELCYLVATLFLGPGRVAVVGDPCYQIDATATLVSGASVRRVPLRQGGHDLRAMAEASDGAAVVWLPSPHNPTGVACDPGDLPFSSPKCRRIVLLSSTRLIEPSPTRSSGQTSINCWPGTPTCSSSARCPKTSPWPDCGSATASLPPPSSRRCPAPGLRSASMSWP